MKTSAISPTPSASVTSAPRISATQPAALIPTSPTSAQRPATTTATPATAAAATASAIQVERCREPFIAPYIRASAHGTVRRKSAHRNGGFHADGKQASRDGRAACRLPQRPDDRRRRGADLPDDELPVPRHRACRQPVRAEGTGQHLYPHHEPDERRA